ncbi:MAG: hypothetical protein RLZZ165_746 [Bacteroidota bacterium]|jgi:hypothetical protein
MDNRMKFLEIKLGDQRLIREFLELPVRIYKNDPLWIRPLDKDIEAVFNPKTNKFWRHGKAIRWILQNGEGETVGRVAAFINERTANTEAQPTGGMGFFECVDDQGTANMLFDKCKEWLTENGMEAMDGPINFGEREAWWGLLYEGRHEPVYQMNYQPEYYIPLFENYGFRTYFKQYVLFRPLMEPMQERLYEKAEMVAKDPNYHFTTLKKNRLGKFAEDFRTILNGAWTGHDGFKPMRKEQAMAIMNRMKPILAEELAIFGYYKDEPIAFFIMIPDMNQVFKDFNGKFGWPQKLKTLWRIKMRKITKCYGIIFGIVKEHQGKGVDGGLINHARIVLHPMNHWNHMEMNWIGDFNPKMLNLARGIGGRDYKTYHTLRYLFDRTKPFKRLPVIGEKIADNSAKS